MTEHSSFSIEKAIPIMAQDSLTNQAIFHWNKLSCSKISYLGFNFHSNKLESVKLYLTAFSNDLALVGQDWDSIDKEIHAIWPYRSPFAEKQYSNGGGLTYSIKINASETLEYGAYLRCSDQAPHSFPVGFDPFPGLYICSSRGELSWNTYAYIDPDSFPTDRFNGLVNWTHIQGIEIAKTNREAIQKHIFLGSEDVLLPALLRQIPQEIMKFRNKNQLQFVCPAFTEQGEFTSIYTTKFSTQSQLPTLQSLIL